MNHSRKVIKVNGYDLQLECGHIAKADPYRDPPKTKRCRECKPDLPRKVYVIDFIFGYEVRDAITRNRETFFIRWYPIRSRIKRGEWELTNGPLQI